VAGADDPPAYLWRENWRVWCLWRELETQWHAGVAGPTGLDYAAVLPLIERRFRRARQRRDVFFLVQAMEEATLDVWRAQQERAAER
jgi:hypothetical protein